MKNLQYSDYTEKKELTNFKIYFLDIDILGKTNFIFFCSYLFVC